MRTALILLAAALILAGCDIYPATPTPAAPLAHLEIISATATQPLLNELTATYSAAYPAFFTADSGNQSWAIERLLARETVYVLTNVLPDDTSTLWYAPLGMDGIAVIVHPANPLRNLSREQVRALFQGRAANWRDVGGVEGPVMPVTRESGSGTRTLFERHALGPLPVTESARLAATSAAVVNIVARNPGAVGYVSMAWVDDGVRAVNIDEITPDRANIANGNYPISAPIVLLGLQAPPNDAYRHFIGWAQAGGQDILARLHARLP